MKVLTFPEFFGLKLPEKIAYYRYFSNKSIMSKNSLDKWYYQKTNQPFKPELIPELFEGWKLTYNANSKYIYSLEDSDICIRIEFDFKYLPNCYFVYKDKYIDTFTDFLFPKTFDEFITDCQRAGIELKWRKK